MASTCRRSPHRSETLLPSSEPFSEALRASLSGRSIFLTGGTGFVGRTLLDYLQSLTTYGLSDFHVVLLSRNPAAFERRYPSYGQLPWLSLLQGSLEALPVPDRCYTDVIHAAADTHLVGHNALWIDQIVGGTRAVLDFALKTGASRFLLTSSGAVYGPQPADVEQLSEDYLGAPSPLQLSSVYGQAKRIAEQLTTIYRQEFGLETVIARCFAFTGAHLSLNGPYAIGNFIRDALSGEPIRVKGDGTPERSYLDGEDMAHWLLSLLCFGKPGEAYNVGSDQAISIQQLAETIRRLLAPQGMVLVEGTESTNHHRSRYVPSTVKAGGLGLQSRFTIDEMVMRTARSVGLVVNEKRTV